MADADQRGVVEIALSRVPAIELAGQRAAGCPTAARQRLVRRAARSRASCRPDWLFGVAWTILYALMGVALALVLAEPPSPRRKTALILFFVQSRSISPGRRSSSGPRHRRSPDRHLRRWRSFAAATARQFPAHRHCGGIAARSLSGMAVLRGGAELRDPAAQSGARDLCRLGPFGGWRKKIKKEQCSPRTRCSTISCE